MILGENKTNGCVALVLVVLVAAAATVGAGEDAESRPMTADLVQKVCHGNHKVRISRVAQMRELINAAFLVEGLCRKRYLSSLAELDSILKVPWSELCEDRTFELIKDYHFRYISPLKHVNRRPTQFEPMPREVVRVSQLHPEPRKYSIELDEYGQTLQIPVTVRHFFLSYVLQVSGHCKRNLLLNLEAQNLKNLLSADDDDLMHVFDRQSPIGQVLADGIAAINFDNVVYMPELEGEIKGQPKANDKQHVYVKTMSSESSSLYRLVTACQEKFKPIYRKLVMPIVRLSKLGYDYLGERLTAEERAQLASSDEVKKWLGIVNVCEMFERVIVITSSEAAEQLASSAATTTTTALPLPAAAEEPAAGSESEPDGGSSNSAAAVIQLGQESVVPISKREAEAAIELEERSRGQETGPESQVELKPKVSFRLERSAGPMDDSLWVSGERQLDLELSRKPGATNPFGFKGFMRRAGARIRRAFAKLDTNKYAHYRRNSLWYSGVLNLISAVTNIASTALTAICVMAVLA